MSNCFIRLLTIFSFVVLISHFGFCQLSEKTKIQTILNTPENKNSLNFVAVFLLTTLNEKFLKNRIDVSKRTWGHPVKHFYAVTGENSENRQILKDSNRCHDHTDHYRKITKHIAPKTREEIYICDGIHVLHMPYCDSSHWGPMVSIKPFL